VVINGLRRKEIRVEADPKKLARYRLSLDELVRALERQNVTVSAGVFEVKDPMSDDREKLVRTVGEFQSLADVEATVVRANETAAPIRIRDVARVYYDLERETVVPHTNGRRSLNLTVLKKANADAISMVDSVRALVEKEQQRLGSHVELGFVNDFSAFIRRRLSGLGGNLVLGLCLVLVILGLLLRFRVAMVVSVGIPFAFLGTIFVFYAGGNSLNLISLLGLIIVCGMIVDDAIVVTDNAVRLIGEGVPPKEAAIRGTQQIWPAVTASVLTTTCAFLPMMFMSGIFGKFVKEIPLGVVFALLFSLGEAFFILPAHIAHWIRSAPARGQDRGKRQGWWIDRLTEASSRLWDERVIPRYRAAVERSIRWRYAVLGATFFIFLALVGFAATQMRFVLFPPDGIEQFFIRFEAPTGLSVEQMERLLEPAEKVVAGLPKKDFENQVTFIGLQADDPNDPFAKRGGEYAQIAVYLTPAYKRVRTVNDIITELRPKIDGIQGFQRVTFAQVSGGPPVGKPVSIGVRGAEYADILPAVEDLKKLVATIPGTTDLADSYVRGKEEIVLEVDGAEAAAAGLSVASIASTVRAAFAGLEATSVRGLDEEVRVRVQLPEEARSSRTTLETLNIPNPTGALVPLKSVTRQRRAQGVSSFDHEANSREVRVTAEVDTQKTSANFVNADLRKQIQQIADKHPKVTFHFGGEGEDTWESLQSLARAFIVAAMAIFLILVFTFQNLLQPLLILLTIPLGIMAVIVTFILHGRPLSFMAMLGIIALAGVIVNNAIILVDFVNQLRRDGKSKLESIIGSTSVRLRPIFLTTSTTVVGLLPTAYGIGGRDDFVVPIALALGWGLLLGSFLTALVFPAAIAVLDDIEERYERWFGLNDRDVQRA
jgi:multidrug efflux pump subunit AcrB